MLQASWPSLSSPLGADPLIVSNAIFLATFPLCALAFFFTAWRLTSDPQAACVAGILGGLSTFKIEHYSHLELQFFFFAPLAVLPAAADAGRSVVAHRRMVRRGRSPRNGSRACISA